jgi:hypothetical protein
MTSLVMLMEVALAFWAGAAPAAVEQRCPTGVRSAVVAQSQMSNQGRGVMAEARYGSCAITFRAGWRRDLTDRQACGVVIHEVGHAALSLHHSEGGIMAGVVPKRLPGACSAFTSRNRDE